MSIVSLNARAPWCDRTAAFAAPVTERPDTTGVQHVQKAHALRTICPFGLDVQSNQYVFRSPQCTQAQGPALAMPAPREIRDSSAFSHPCSGDMDGTIRNSLRPEYLQGPDGPADPELADGTPREREPGCRFPGSGSQGHEHRTLNIGHKPRDCRCRTLAISILWQYGDEQRHQSYAQMPNASLMDPGDADR